MKVGDLVYCPVDLLTGEMFCNVKTLAIITGFREREPKVEVIYCGEADPPQLTMIRGTWFSDELEEISN